MLTYDQTGNMDTDRSGNRVFTYNAAGRLAQVDDLSGTLGQYTYDANGQRSQKSTAFGTTQFIYGAGGRLLGEYDASGDIIREYVYLNGEPLAQINGGATESLLYLHTDHLATPRAATNQVGTQVWSWESDAFGRGTPTGTETVNLRFPGQYYDIETDLHYNWNRYYNPETGRYITSDPIGLDGGLNTYAYVNASPIMFSDPEGLDVDFNFHDPNCQTITDENMDECVTYTPSGTRLTEEGYAQTKLIPDNNTCITIAAQGNDRYIKNGVTDSPVNLRELADKIKNHPKYHAGTSNCIILYSCNSGKGTNPPAKQLKKHLGEKDTVTGFSGSIVVGGDGSVHPSPDDGTTKYEF